MGSHLQGPGRGDGSSGQGRWACSGAKAGKPHCRLPTARGPGMGSGAARTAGTAQSCREMAWTPEQMAVSGVGRWEGEEGCEKPEIYLLTLPLLLDNTENCISPE